MSDRTKDPWFAPCDALCSKDPHGEVDIADPKCPVHGPLVRRTSKTITPEDPEFGMFADTSAAREIERLRAELKIQDDANELLTREIERLRGQLDAVDQNVKILQEQAQFDLGPSTDWKAYKYWEYEAGPGEVTCHSRVIAGVLCRWWGEGAAPRGVAVIDQAAALAGFAVETNEWQPIESIPMDGTPVLAWSPEPFHGKTPVQVATYHPNCKIVGGIFLFDLRGEQRPTHWRPMLAGPTEKTTEHADDCSTRSMYQTGQPVGYPCDCGAEKAGDCLPPFYQPEPRCSQCGKPEPWVFTHGCPEKCGRQPQNSTDQSNERT